jgi:hypothetical protein
MPHPNNLVSILKQIFYTKYVEFNKMVKWDKKSGNPNVSYPRCIILSFRNRRWDSMQSMRYSDIASIVLRLIPNPLLHPLSSSNVATLALGLWPRQRGCKVVGQEKTQESHHILRKCRKVWESEPSHSQGNSHFGRWSPDGLPKFQRAILGVKTQWLVTFFISLERSWNLDV